MSKIETISAEGSRGKRANLILVDDFSLCTERYKPRLFELQIGDIFSIDLNTFMNSSVYWSKIFQIQKFETKWYKKKILFFKVPWKKYIMVQLIYMGE